MKKVEEMSLEELKVMGYDHIAELDRVRASLSEINRLIAVKSQENATTQKEKPEPAPKGRTK